MGLDLIRFIRWFLLVVQKRPVSDSGRTDEVMTSEQDYFEVEGPAEIIFSPAAHTNPAKTEFGTATALLRANTTPGTIRIKA